MKSAAARFDVVHYHVKTLKYYLVKQLIELLLVLGIYVEH